MGYGGGTAALDSQTSGGPVAGWGAGEPMDGQGEFWMLVLPYRTTVKSINVSSHIVIFSPHGLDQIWKHCESSIGVKNI